MPNLFDPITMGALTLPNRILMAPMTRGRAEKDGVPGDLMAEYYAQRAAAGLIITEATSFTPEGYGWVGAPGFWTAEQSRGWKKVTDAVHQRGGRIVLQLWHMGRVSHPDFLGGHLPVGPSAIAATGESHTPQGKKPYVTPRALSIDEIGALIKEYGKAAQRAADAGFDGVEVHAANGYLLDQFIRDGSNTRTDAYGGSRDNRLRFMLEATQAACDAIGSGRVGVRFSPTNPYNDMKDSDPVATFTRAAELLVPLKLAYLHLMEPIGEHPFAGTGERVTPHIRKAYNGALIANGGYSLELGNRALANGEADAIAFGVPFLANPDLVERFRRQAALNAPHFDSFYTPGARGYTDYPALEQKAA